MTKSFCLIWGEGRTKPKLLADMVSKVFILEQFIESSFPDTKSLLAPPSLVSPSDKSGRKTISLQQKKFLDFFVVKNKINYNQ